jgi:hypothetical protein
MASESPPVNLGNCARVLDEDTEEICNSPGFDEVLVRSKFGLFAVPLCRGCKTEHQAFYARIRSRPRRARNVRASQSRGRPSDNASRVGSTNL